MFNCYEYLKKQLVYFINAIFHTLCLQKVVLDYLVLIVSTRAGTVLMALSVIQGTGLVHKAAKSIGAFPCVTVITLTLTLLKPKM